MKLFQTIYLFFNGNYKADADLMIGDNDDDYDDDDVFFSVLGTRKGFGNCAHL